MGITIYGCGQDEAVLFREIAPRIGVMPTITEAPVSEANIELALGNRCISVGHKTQITNSALLALSQADVTYIATRSIGYNHIDVKYAESVGNSVENVAYSPDKRGRLHADADADGRAECKNPLSAARIFMITD